MPRLFYLRVKAWFEEKRDAVPLASQLVDDSVHGRPQVVVGPVAMREGRWSATGRPNVNKIVFVSGPFDDKNEESWRGELCSTTGT